MPAKVMMSSVVIAEEKTERIKAAISQLEYHDLIFNRWGFSEVFEKGTAVSLMFYGIPGTGKTLMAQAIADYLAKELKIIGTAEIESSEPGGAERAIKKVFQEATSSRGQVLLFDECDSLLVDRNSVGVIIAAQINTLLSELERFTGVVIFTTNRLGKLDPALERRIAAKIEFEFPDKTQRVAIWRRMIPKQAPLAKDVDFEVLASYPLAGGNIKNAVLNAARMAAYRQKRELDLASFTEAIEKEVEGLNEFMSAYEDSANASRVRRYDSSQDFKREPGGVGMPTQDIGASRGIDKVSGMKKLRKATEVKEAVND